MGDCSGGKIRMITTSTEKFHSADFDKTPPTITVHIRKQLVNAPKPPQFLP
jgi:hypothetical protein